MKVLFHISVVLLILLGVCFCGNAFAYDIQFNDERHHVIVVVDRSQSMYDGSYGQKQALRQIFTSDLPSVIFEENMLENGRPLYDASSGDLLSVVSFGLMNDFNNFIHTQEAGAEYGYSYKDQMNRDSLAILWKTIDQLGTDFFSKGWTVVSASLPLSIAHLKSDAHAMHRTFFVLISDYEYNMSGNPSSEMQEIAAKNSIRNADLAIRMVDEVLSTYSIESFNTGSRTRRNIQIRLFELHPRTRFFSVESILDFDNRRMEFNRVPYGYASKFELTPKAISGGFIEKLEAVITQDGIETLVASDVIEDLSQERVLSLEIPDTMSAKVSEVSFKFWVRIKDGLYNAHVIHPDGLQRRNNDVAQRTLPIEFEPDKKILGMLPLPDPMLWMAFLVGLKSQQNALVLWNSVIVCLFLGLAYLGIRSFISKSQYTDPTHFTVK